MPARLAIARFALALPVALMALMLAILAIIVAKPARSAQLDPAGCTRNLTETTAKLAALKVELKGTATGKRCTVTRLYFLEAVKARAVTALCKLDYKSGFFCFSLKNHAAPSDGGAAQLRTAVRKRSADPGRS